MSIRAVVVDDERFSREELIFLIERYPSIEVIGEADSGEVALMKTIQLQPDVLFLDVEMPKMDGMEVAKSVRELKKVPEIVFATAYSDFAVEAFRHNAVDYLLKPFDEEQLSHTIERLEKKLIGQKSYQEKTWMPTKLAVEEDGDIRYLDPNDILYVYREGRVTKVVGKARSYEINWALKDIEARLTPFSFFRIHKSYLVNLNYIDRLTPWFNGAYHLELKGHEEKLSVSRNYVKNLRNQLEL
ncbi:LytTR family DNA-binding domain-containing protein [Halobacillus shinanisalinarum]|uniref:LytTR family DNA-binding domain-containing protein n=1 Tax=Halobacillus shinanisalinarum TaxID=2932258 RepID=A0ABY4GUC3_9BACI|nr:LytTR family DNA-binding domain-containing protein [Halobacillus shinanisalinarum]UOQ91748.1 LytTR family DNA-binding domain-containing protein [Halobacillus shinanisalinarum]